MEWKFIQAGETGLGDSVARIIHTITGIEPCGGCKERQEILNKLVPYEETESTNS